jgi:serine/threonine protein kinase
MEECKVLHCDVKPENVMSEIDSQSVRLIDFGAVRPMVNNDYFDVQSLWYRAPEVLANQRYDHRIDVWSLGCMAVELWTRSPLFPGQNPAEQIRRIQQLANPQALARHLAPYFARDNSSAVLKSCFMDFVCAALSIDPKNRPLPSEAVLHPLFQSSVRVNPAPLVPWEDATWSPGGSASTEDWTDMSWGEIPEASLLSAAIVPRAERYHTGPDMGYQMTSSCLMPYFASPCAI